LVEKLGRKFSFLYPYLYLDVKPGDKKYRFEHWRIAVQDSTYIGTTRGQNRTLLGSLAPLDGRHFDPNVLRFGAGWRPDDLSPESISENIKMQQHMEKHLPNYRDKTKLEKQTFPEHQKNYKEISCDFLTQN